ncbi:MAG: hypothetical protein Q7R30_02850 [Acidobacteriota bacterium]|nr:hypothetical protein [Acidobacteriota bacterium]
MNRSELRRTALVALGFAALTIAFAYPVSMHPATTLLADNPDTHLFLWTLAWDAHALIAQPLSLFDANIYFPYSGTLAYSENLLGSGLLAAPIIWLTGNLVLALNFVQLASCVLCGLGAYVLARRIGISRAGAVLAGIVFLAAPPRFFRIGQLHLTAVQWVPFGLAYLHTYLDGGRKRDLRIAVAFFTLQALTSGHGAIFLGVSMLALVIYRVALGEPLALAKRARDLGVAGLALLVPLVWLFAPYRAAQAEVGLKRSLESWLPTPSSYLATPSHLHQYLRALITDTNFNDTASAWLFPGVTVLIFAAMALLPSRTLGIGDDWRARLRRNSGVFYALLALLAVWLFLPAPVGLWPYVYALPGMNFIRVPSRFMILAMLALGVAMGAGFDRLLALSDARAFARGVEGLGASRAALRTTAAIVVGVMLIAEYASMPLASVPFTVDIPAIDRWLDTQPKPFAIAEVPVPSPGDLGAYERQQTMAMLHSTAHWQKTIHGYSGIRPALHQRLNLELTAFPDETSLRSLRELGVRYVVVHEEMYPPERRVEVDARYARHAGDLRLEHVEGPGRIYLILPKPPAP